MFYDPEQKLSQFSVSVNKATREFIAEKM